MIFMVHVQLDMVLSWELFVVVHKLGSVPVEAELAICDLGPDNTNLVGNYRLENSVHWCVVHFVFLGGGQFYMTNSMGKRTILKVGGAVLLGLMNFLKVWNYMYSEADI